MSRNRFNKQASNYVEWYKNSNPEPIIEFINWISIIEKKIITKYGLTLIDIPDEDYMMYFVDGYTSKMVIQIIQKSNGFI
jgi:hypothetical protein